jgi:hypothetical protein
MRDSAEGQCLLLERTSEVEKKIAKIEGKQWVLIALVSAMFAVLSYGFFKLLDSQIYLLSGEKGLRVISSEAQSDMSVIRSQEVLP